MERRPMPRGAKPATSHKAWGLGALLLGAAAAALSLYLAYFWRAEAQPDRATFTGSIIMTSADGNDCRYFSFNNMTGLIKAVGARKCSDETNGQKNSLNEISKSFR
jgi:hypothetical protein